MSWSPSQYLKFEDERTRPARDLLNAVPAADVRRAADLGCGPGNSTQLLIERFPGAEITGIDNSEAMIEAARARLPRTRFELSAIEDWRAPGPWDLIYANASFQWVPGHETLLPRLAGRLSPGGSLAIQMPDNLDEPSHASMRTVASQPHFAEKLKEEAKARTLVPGLDWYYALLKPHCARVDIWRTTYVHPLAGLDAIIEWLKGTGLMPFLKPLNETEREAYLAAYKAEIAKAYKPVSDRTVLLLFPRLFIVAAR
jgi:trans-aconitate 2-methyltransferase